MNAQVTTPVVPATEVKDIVKLEANATLKDLVAKVNELVDKANMKRDRGPESTKTMTEDDAKAILLGEDRGLSHSKAAEKYGLSYGQVYSARKGFTFKPIYKEAVKKGFIKE